MRYWAYINNQVCGPVEIKKLPELANFTLSSLVCPEVPAGAEAVAWKEASACSEVMAALDPASAPAPAPAPAPEPAPARAPAAESPLMMTMRGTLINEPPVEPSPAYSPAKAVTPSGPQRPAAAAAPAASAGQEQELMQKLSQMSAMMASIANNQSQLLDRLGRVESAVTDMKSLLFPAPPKK